MDDDDPTFMFTPDILVGRMEQVRRIVITMANQDLCKEELTLLVEATNILLDSVSMPDKEPNPKNVVAIH